MTSPLLQFNNARLLWEAPGGRSSAQDGFQILPGKRWLVTAFLKLSPKRSDYKDVIDLSIATDVLEGYITGTMPLQDGQDWKTYDFASDSSFDTTATRPPGFEPPAEVEIQMGHRYSPRGQMLNTAGKYDDLGIGEIIRDVLGDRLFMKVEWW